MKRMKLDTGFIRVNGPLFGRLEADGRPVMGFFVEDRHVNPAGICHGGMLMTFADMLLGLTTSLAGGDRKFLPTVNMTADFLAPAPLGAWVEGQGRLLRLTRNLAFADGVITADGETCMRASGMMKIPSKEMRGFAVSALFE